VPAAPDSESAAKTLRADPGVKSRSTAVGRGKAVQWSNAPATRAAVRLAKSSQVNEFAKDMLGATTLVKVPDWIAWQPVIPTIEDLRHRKEFYRSIWLKPAKPTRRSFVWST